MRKITLLLLSLYCAVANSQAVSGYTFSQSTEVYVPVSGTNSTAIDDDGIENGLPIGFNFKFGGVDYTTFSISTNGWIRLGADIGNQSWINSLSNTAVHRPLIAAFWDDHNRGTGSIQYAVSGTAPNRMLEIGWDNINLNNNGQANTTAFGSFKMRLHESTSIIDFVYGPTMNAANTPSASIGINDQVSFLSVTPSGTATVSSATPNDNVSSTTQLIGKKYTFTPQPQCSGTPAPGNTIASSTSACELNPLNLSLENTLDSYGISYQWQQSVDGITYEDIVNGVYATQIVNQTEAHYYRCLVSCGANSSASNPVSVAQTPASECYCAPTYDHGKTDGDLISNVTITGTTLANDTGTEPVDPYYTYFTGAPNLTADLLAGYAYEMNVSVGSYGQQHVAVWIDYNDDIQFTPEERIGYTEGEIDSFGTATFTIQLDCAAPAGSHRMRIRDVWGTDSSTIEPCSNYGYGETEDYIITVSAQTTCQPPYALNATVENSSAATLEWNAGCNQSAWDVNVAPAGSGVPTGAPTNPQVTSGVVVSGLAQSTDYEFYVRANCDTFGSSDWAGPFAFSTLAAVVANDDCQSATALTVGGSFADHAVTATNVGATRSVGEPNPTCGVFGFGGDVWFSAVVPASGTLTFEVAADAGSPVIDTALSAFSGTCGNLTTLGCNDDQGINSFSILHLTGLTAGETIYARVWEYANDTYGTFQVSAWDPSLANRGFARDGFKYYPNPVCDYLNLSYASEISEVSIFNLLGQQMLTRTVNSKQCRIDLSELASGQYLVRVASGTNIENIKIIKQ